VKSRKCLVCRVRKRLRGENLCKQCLTYYRKKYGKNFFDDEEFIELMRVYNEEANQDED